MGSSLRSNEAKREQAEMMFSEQRKTTN